jgi:ferredoxin
MKIAVIGSGPAAFATICAIRAKTQDAQIFVFDRAEEIPQDNLPPTSNPADPNYLATLYKGLRKSQGFTFPPPKSAFGQVPARHKINEKNRVWKSQSFGGLSNWWGGSILPFTDRELDAWPINSRDLSPYYQSAADTIGISGSSDSLDRYFGSTFANRPPLQIPGQMTALGDAADGYEPIEGGRLLAGVGRLALETRPDRADSCINCGGCMSGCSRQSLFSSAPPIKAMIQSKSVHTLTKATVSKIRPDSRQLVLETNGQEITTDQFDKIYVAAGCAGTTEILMRSYGITRGPMMSDNAVYSFPILYTGLRLPKDTSADPAFVLSNLVFGLVPDEKSSPLIQIQVYPSFEHLWRYYLPTQVWPLADRLGKISKNRLFWARLYLPGTASARYEAILEDGKPFRFELNREHPSTNAVLPIIDQVRKALKKSRFSVPRIPPISHSTSSHYAGTFPYHNSLLNMPSDGQISPGLYVCDSTVFNSAPSISPTFTIMANAWRTADKSLDQ